MAAPTPSPDTAGQPRWWRAPQALWRDVAEGVLLLDGGSDPATGPEPVLLTGPGADVWAGLADGPTRAELAARLGATYRAEPGQLAADLAAVLDDLLARGLVTTGGEG